MCKDNGVAKADVNTVIGRLYLLLGDEKAVETHLIEFLFIVLHRLVSTLLYIRENSRNGFVELCGVYLRTSAETLVVGWGRVFRDIHFRCEWFCFPGNSIPEQFVYLKKNPANPESQETQGEEMNEAGIRESSSR